MGGPQLMGSGKMFASAIGEDYDWSSYGWQVIRYPKAEDIRAGDILNWETSGTLATSVYGHTGVVTSVSNVDSLWNSGTKCRKRTNCITVSTSIWIINDQKYCTQS